MSKARWILTGALLATASTAAATAPGWEGLERFARIYGQIRTYAAVEPDGEKLVDDALTGMLAGVDPYSAYYTADAWREVEAETAGTGIGIGAEVAEDPCGLRVMTLTSGGPAERADLRPGDCILAIDGTPARTKGQLDGPADVALKLTLDQAGARREAVVLRARLSPAAVQAAPGPDATAWVRVASFRIGAARELERALTGLGPVTGVVLDLRQDPGGAIEEAVAVADRFLGVGEVVRVEGRGPGVEKIYPSTDAADDLAMPLVVLVDGGTASAAEIVAGALRARGRAKIVGSPTFGKGTVQTWLHQANGSTAKLTIGRYVLPDGARLDVGAGLQPDVRVDLASIPSPLGRVRERVRAVPGLSPSDRAALLAEVEAAGTTTSRPGLPSFGPPIDDRIALDPQLAAAFAALRP